MELQIKMISSASRVLSYHRENPNSIDEDIFQDLSDYISEQSINDEKVIRAMMATASIAIKLKRKSLESEKQVLKKVIEEIPRIVQEIDE